MVDLDCAGYPRLDSQQFASQMGVRGREDEEEQGGTREGGGTGRDVLLRKPNMISSPISLSMSPLKIWFPNFKNGTAVSMP